MRALLLCFLSGVAWGATPAIDVNIYCYRAFLAGVPCTSVTKNASYVASHALSVSVPQMPYQGDSVATVNERYPTVMAELWERLTPAQLNAQFALVDNGTLARMSQALYVATHGDMAEFNSVIAIPEAKLSAANLARWRQAFAAENPTVIAQSYAHHARGRTLAFTMNGLSGGVPAPNVNMTLTEIFTEFLFTNSETVAEALFRAAVFATEKLNTAFMVGYSVGSVIYAIGDYVDPGYGADLVELYGDGSLVDGGIINLPTPDVVVTFGNIVTYFPDGTVDAGGAAIGDLTLWDD